MSVDIVKEVDQPVFQHNNREVNDQDRNRVREIYLLGRTTVHGLVNALRVPAGIVAQHPCGEFGGLFQPDTAVTEIPPRLLEQLRRRSIVHVYAIAVRKAE